MTMLPHNIKPAGYRRGEYTGYADGAWRITRASKGKGWHAQKISGDFASRHGSTLIELGRILDLYARRIK